MASPTERGHRAPSSSPPSPSKAPVAMWGCSGGKSAGDALRGCSREGEGAGEEVALVDGREMAAGSLETAATTRSGRVTGGKG